MPLVTESVGRLIDELAKLPGIGRKSAERLAYHILRVNKNEALGLADAIRNVKENVRYCKMCYNLAEADECVICRDPTRDREFALRGRAAARFDGAWSRPACFAGCIMCCSGGSRRWKASGPTN